MTYESAWYWVRALPPIERPVPPPSDHPEHERIVALQEAAYTKKLASLHPREVKMWGPQIEFLLKGEPYTVLGLVE